MSELVRSALGPPRWENRIPNIRDYGLTESEAESLTSFWRARSLLLVTVCLMRVSLFPPRGEGF